MFTGGEGRWLVNKLTLYMATAQTQLFLILTLHKGTINRETLPVIVVVVFPMAQQIFSFIASVIQHYGLSYCYLKPQTYHVHAP